MTLKKKHRRNHSQGASGENPRRNHSQRACGEKNEVKQQGYEDSEKNTKIWSDDDKNREEQSQQQAEEQSQTAGRRAQANSRQDKSRANSRQSKPKDYDRDKAKYEEKHSTEESCSQPVPHPRTDADVQQGQYELKLGEVITTIPEIDFDEEIVEYKKIVQKAQEQ